MREMMVIVSWNFCTTCVLYISVMLRRRFPACSWFVLCILRFYLTNQEENGSKQDSRKSVWSRRRWSVSPTALTENNTDLIWPAEFQSSPTTRTLWTPRGLRKRWEISNAAGLIFFFPRLLFFPPSGRVCWLMHSAETDRLLQRRSLSHPGVDLSHASSALSFAKACMHVHPFPPVYCVRVILALRSWLRKRMRIGNQLVQDKFRLDRHSGNLFRNQQ